MCFEIISSSIYFIIYNIFNRYDNKILNNNINIEWNFICFMFCFIYDKYANYIMNMLFLVKDFKIISSK